MREVLLQEVKSGNHECYVLRWWEVPKRMSLTVGWVKIKGEKCDGGKYISDREARARQRDKQTEVDLAERAERVAAKEAASPTVEPVAQPNSVTLREFHDGYAGRRRRTEVNNRGYLKDAPKLSEASITSHLMTLRYLLETSAMTEPLTRSTWRTRPSSLSG